ncbi:MAG: ParB/RepB/Spo0J family partition protein [Proteobacteria bacterium]|nr:ParB/RepB/Spo0J family partition protein [Pseudomonadota bacterium]MBU1389600.1 ParB/RepB/Spo0J family partition protein [Pseudomonadota bacterium]MBU1544464.1 ParB/RepB/Spo0J family partition protein [Pseudomonadota bacterium]
MSEYTSAIIDVHQIDLCDKRFKISLSDTDIDALAHSIKTIGLICFPLLRPMGHNTFMIICGFNRIQALIKNKISRIPAVIVPENTSELDCYKKAITALSFKQPLTHAQLIVCVNRLISFCDAKTIAQMAPSVFNLALNEKFIQDLLQISALPDPCLKLVHTEQLAIKSARRLADFDARTTAVFLDLFSKIKASSSKQFEIITFMTETAARDGISVDSLYHDPQFQTILSNPDLPLGIKTNEIRLFLYEKRYPSIFDARKKVLNHIHDLKLGPGIKLVPPENFEGTDYQWSFTTKNLREFKGHLETFSRVIQDKSLAQILKP